MGGKFLVTLGLVLRHHFLKCIADERARRVKHPVALGASEAVKILGLDLNKLAGHRELVPSLARS